MNPVFKYIIIAFFLCPVLVLGQTNNPVLNETIDVNGKKVVMAYLVPYNGDSIPLLYLEPCKVSDERVFKDKSKRKKYDALVKKVRKVYPYAKLAGSLLRAYNDTLIQMGGGEYYQKKYMKKVEEALKRKFGKELENLTITEGRILIKLIDRETGKTSYELVKEMRGVFSAVVWQTMAKIFGQNLKNSYDAEGEDQMIEQIIQNIENGAYN